MLLQRPEISLLGAAVFLESLRLLEYHFPSWKLWLSNSRLGTHLFSNTGLDCHFKHTWARCDVVIGQTKRIHFTAVNSTNIIQIKLQLYIFAVTTTMFQTPTSGNLHQPMSNLWISYWMAIVGKRKIRKCYSQTKHSRLWLVHFRTTQSRFQRHSR